MTINILGNAPKIRRLETGLWSFDRAFQGVKGEIGFPLGKGMELFGVTHCGKSTITYGLSGIIAASQEKNIALADLEGFDPDFLVTVLESVNFSGDVQYIQKGTDEAILDELVVFLRNPEYCVGILDSIGAISPIPEQEGAIGEANMGARAKRMAQFVRKARVVLNTREELTQDAPSIFMINHAYPRIGGVGKDTPGGEVKKYLASMRVEVKRRYYKGYEEYPDGSYVIEGKVVKNRWGIKDKVFYLFVLSGKGIHRGLTAMYDGFMIGAVGRKKVITIGDKSFGYMKNIIAEAQAGNEKFFKPFYKVLEDYEQSEDTENGKD